MEHIRHVGQFTRQFSEQSLYDTEFQSLYADFLKKIQYLNDASSLDVFWDELKKLQALANQLHSKYFDPNLTILSRDATTSRFIADLKDECQDVQTQLRRVSQ